MVTILALVFLLGNRNLELLITSWCSHPVIFCLIFILPQNEVGKGPHDWFHPCNWSIHICSPAVLDHTMRELAFVTLNMQKANSGCNVPLSAKIWGQAWWLTSLFEQKCAQPLGMEGVGKPFVCWDVNHREFLHVMTRRPVAASCLPPIRYPLCPVCKLQVMKSESLPICLTKCHLEQAPFHLTIKSMDEIL